MKKAKILSLAVALLLALGVLAGCGQPGTSSQVPASQAPAPAGDDTSAPTGETMEILWSINDQATGALPEADGLVVKQLEEKFNVKLNFFPANSISNMEQWNLLISSGEIPDVWYDYGGDGGLAWYNQGIVRPVTEAQIQANMPTTYAHILALDPDLRSFSKRVVDGGLLGVPSVTTEGASCFYRVYRKDWLDALDLPVPTTLEELDTIVRAFTFDDPDGNGVQDTYGVNSENNLVEMGDVFGAFGVQPNVWLAQDDGTVIHSNISDGYKEGLKYLAGWYKDGVINPEFLTDTWEQFAADFVDGRAGSYYLNWRWAGTAWADSPVSLLLAANDTAEVVLGDAVTGPDSKSGAYGYGTDLGWSLMFNYQIDDAKMERAMQVVDYLQTDEGLVLGSFGVEGETYTLDETGKAVSSLSMEDQVKQGINCFPLWPNNALMMLKLGSGVAFDEFEKGLEQPWISDALSGTPLPKSEAANVGLDLGNIYEKYFFDAVTGKVDVDASWDAYAQQCLSSGLTERTEEANEVYAANFK